MAPVARRLRSSARTEPPPTVSTYVFGAVAEVSVIASCLRVRADALPRSAFARFIGRSPLSDDSRPWYLGALDELDVAAHLASLDEGWTALHSVPVGTRLSDIDHVVDGAAGVITITSKFHEVVRVWVGARRILASDQKLALDL